MGRVESGVKEPFIHIQTDAWELLAGAFGKQLDRTQVPIVTTIVFKGNSQQVCCVTQGHSQRILSGNMAKHNKEEQVQSVPVSAISYSTSEREERTSPVQMALQPGGYIGLVTVSSFPFVPPTFHYLEQDRNIFVRFRVAL